MNESRVYLYLKSSHLPFSSTLTLPRSVTSGKSRDAIINEYYDETNLLTVIESWIKQLIHQEELPYNPYPGLVWQARRCAERYSKITYFLKKILRIIVI